jgi:hypothetical protein
VLLAVTKCFCTTAECPDNASSAFGAMLYEYGEQKAKISKYKIKANQFFLWLVKGYYFLVDTKIFQSIFGHLKNLINAKFPVLVL